MKRRAHSPAPWCIVLALAVAITAAAPAWAITWGEVDAANRYPYVGAVVVLPVPGSGAVPRVYCSGTLIHPKVMLTAAHCTRSIESWLAQGAPMWALQVSFAPYALEESSWLEVERVITHPEYNEYDGPGGTANPREVGVIILKKPVKKIEPAALPEPGLLDFLKDLGALRDGPEGGTPLTVTGYGSTLEFPPPEMVPPDGWRRFVEGEFRALNNAWLITSRNQATDDGGGAVQYYFECDQYPDVYPDGFSSGWIDTNTWEIEQVGRAGQGLRFRVRARDEFGNMTAWSAWEVAIPRDQGTGDDDDDDDDGGAAGGG